MASGWKADAMPHFQEKGQRAKCWGNAGTLGLGLQRVRSVRTARSVEQVPAACPTTSTGRCYDTDVLHASSGRAMRSPCVRLVLQPLGAREEQAHLLRHGQAGVLEQQRLQAQVVHVVLHPRGVAGEQQPLHDDQHN